MGHLPTLADLIDNWEMDENGRMWWGDKSADDESTDYSSSTDQMVRHAGTSANKDLVGPIRMECLYAGTSYRSQRLSLQINSSQTLRSIS